MGHSPFCDRSSSSAASYHGVMKGPGRSDFRATDDTEPAVVSKVRPIQVVQTRYEIDVEVGAGGLGRVVRAYDLRLERAVALKTLTSNNDHMKKRFLQEARITARLEHP